MSATGTLASIRATTPCNANIKLIGSIGAHSQPHSSPDNSFHGSLTVRKPRSMPSGSVTGFVASLIMSLSAYSKAVRNAADCTDQGNSPNTLIASLGCRRASPSRTDDAVHEHGRPSSRHDPQVSDDSKARWQSLSSPWMVA
jgi:hypothetical protein